MIHEYALEPSVLVHWATNERDYAEFFREYGCGSPRVFSTFPTQKAGKLRSYLLQSCPSDSQSTHSRRYVELVEALVETVILRLIPENSYSSWNESVVSENQRLAFHAVISKESINIDRNLTIANMHGRESVWNHKRQENILRTTLSFTSVFLNLLRYSCDKVVFVDAYGWSEDSINMIQRLIKLSFQNRLTNKCPEFILHFKEKQGGRHSGQGSPGANYVKQKILSGLDQEINLSVNELKECISSDVFHNRCLLSEHGGIIYGHGLDIKENYLHTDEALLMERQIYEKKCKQFFENISFEVVSKA
jgi:hypothetical protein